MAFRNVVFAAVAAVVLAGSLGMPAQAQTDRDGQQRWINIVNRSGVAIHYFYMTDVDTRGWGDDRLGNDTVEPGDSMRVLPTPRQRSRGYCQYDMKIVFANERSVERRGVNLCQTTNLICTSTGSCRTN